MDLKYTMWKSTVTFEHFGVEGLVLNTSKGHTGEAMVHYHMVGNDEVSFAMDIEEFKEKFELVDLNES